MPQETQEQSSSKKAKWLTVIGTIAAWIWTIVCGGGGAMLLIEKGPWPLTNGWFALFSGIAACPLTAVLSKRIFGIKLSGWTQFAVAFIIWLSGQIARRTGI